MKRKPLELIFDDGPRQPRRKVEKQIHATSLKAAVERADRKRKAAAQRVDRRAYTFKPEILVSVGVDPQTQRIMVSGLPAERSSIVEHFARTVAAAAKVLCTQTRMERQLYIGRDCRHVKTQRRRYLAGSDQGVEIWTHGQFCVRCGAKMSKDPTIPAEAVRELKETILKLAARPKVRKHVEA